MKRLYFLFIAAVFASSSLFAQNDYVQESSTGDYPIFGIGISASTFGPGVEIDFALSKAFTLRVGGSYFQYIYTGSISHWKIYGNYTATFGCINLIADYNFAKVLHLSGGVMYNMVDQGIIGQPQDSYSIGNVQVTPEQIGNVKIHITPNQICPYLGIGVGKPLDRNHLISFFFDVGAVYQGSPKVDLQAEGMLHPTANDAQTQTMNQNLESMKFYPMVSLRVIFKLF
jgi:hypothetical protein